MNFLRSKALLRALFFASLLLILGGTGATIFFSLPPPAKKISHPAGLWEHKGTLPDGRPLLIRVQMLPGPFMKYLGFRGTLAPLTPEQTTAALLRMETTWHNLPEELARYTDNGFYSYGGDTDGELYFSYDPATGKLLSYMLDSAWLEFEKVETFTPFQALLPQNPPSD